MLDLNEGDDVIEITVGIPGYSDTVGNSRGGGESVDMLILFYVVCFPSLPPFAPPHPTFAGWALLFMNHISAPTQSPVAAPTFSTMPSSAPTQPPTAEPTVSFVPSRLPSYQPTSSPSGSPAPTINPTINPTSNPTRIPTLNPTNSRPPTMDPSPLPQPRPTRGISLAPTIYESTYTGSIGFLILAWSAAITVFCMAIYSMARCTDIDDESEAPGGGSAPPLARRPGETLVNSIPAVRYVDTHHRSVAARAAARDGGIESEIETEVCAICVSSAQTKYILLLVYSRARAWSPSLLVPFIFTPGNL